MKELLAKKIYTSDIIFDIGVLSYISLLPLMKGVWQNIFLIHGIIVILCLSLVSTKQREYKSIPLAILALWGIVNMFWRSFGGLKRGDQVIDYFTQQINWSLLNEGFIYILIGILLIRVIVEYSKFWKLYFIPVMFWLFYFLGIVGFNLKNMAVCKWVYIDGQKIWSEFIADWSMTPVLAVVLAAILTMLYHKRTRMLSLVGMFFGCEIIFYKWDYIWKVKWVSRPDFWKATIQRIIHSPLGYGFYHTINTKDGLVAPELKEFGYCLERWGAGWRHNDLLEFTEYLGVVAFICMVWFLVQTFWKSKGGLAYFLGLSAMFMCMFQRTMFFPVKGGIIAVILALLILENGKYHALP